MTPTIVVLDDWEHGLTRLVDWSPIASRSNLKIHHERLRGDALLEQLGQAQCIVLMRDRTPVTKELLSQLPALRHIIFTGTRNNKLDQQAAAAAGITVSNTEWGPSKASTCELTWSLILAAAKKLPDLLVDQQQPAWRTPAILQGLPDVLEGKRLGLIGFGHIGKRVAKVAAAFGMEVVTWSPHMTQARAEEGGANAVSLEALLQSSDIVSLHIVASESTRHLLNEQTLAQMRPGAILVNTSRSTLVKTDALVSALDRGHPAIAALDVFDDEPDIPAALLASPNVILTPHMGFVCEPVYRTFAADVQRQLTEWLAQQS